MEKNQCQNYFTSTVCVTSISKSIWMRYKKLVEMWKLNCHHCDSVFHLGDQFKTQSLVFIIHNLKFKMITKESLSWEHTYIVYTSIIIEIFRFNPNWKSWKKGALHRETTKDYVIVRDQFFCFVWFLETGL